MIPDFGQVHEIFSISKDFIFLVLGIVSLLLFILPFDWFHYRTKRNSKSMAFVEQPILYLKREGCESSAGMTI